MMVLSFFKFSDRRSRSPFFSVRVFSRFRFPRGEPRKTRSSILVVSVSVQTCLNFFKIRSRLCSSWLSKNMSSHLEGGVHLKAHFRKTNIEPSKII